MSTLSWTIFRSIPSNATAKPFSFGVSGLRLMLSRIWFILSVATSVPLFFSVRSASTYFAMTGAASLTNPSRNSACAFTRLSTISRISRPILSMNFSRPPVA